MTHSQLANLRRRFLQSALALKRLARDPRQRNPFVFVIASAFLEYLSKLAYNGGRAAEYKRFITRYLSVVNHRYRTFQYRFANGTTKRDLPIQMYHVLRCGIIHGYSLFPDTVAASRGGRNRSIVLVHRQARVEHLALRYHNHEPTCVLVAEDFAADIEAVVIDLFRKARKNKALTRRIGRWAAKHPPIQGGVAITRRP